MKVRKMRLLRLKYGILRRDLGKHCGISPQRISEIELEKFPGLETSTKKRIENAFSEIISSRQRELNAFRDDFEKHKASLFEGVEEYSYEL